MIYAAPSSTVEIVADGYATALTGTIGYRIRDNQGADSIARTTTGISEDIATSGIYRAQFTAPTTAGQYTIVWDDGSGKYATEELVVTLVTLGSVVSTGAPPSYVTTAQLKATLQLTGTAYDTDIAAACVAASRAIDGASGRRFYLDANASQVRYYTPESWRILPIDDLAVLTSVTIDRTGTGVFSETWTNGTDFVLEPFNAPADFWPYEFLRVRRLAGRWMPTFIEKSVSVTGQFGWSVLPDDIYTATEILAGKLFKRIREAPFGIVSVGIDQGAAMRIARTDPDVAPLISRFVRKRTLI